jgi:rod shape-determining protein MreC
MKYRNRRRKTKFFIPVRYIFIVLAVVCFAGAFLSLTFNLKGGPINTIAEGIFVPMQKGINGIGTYINNKSDHFQTLSQVQEENKKQQDKINALMTENSTLKLEQYELDNLRKLYELDQKYPSYKKVGARVIAKDAGNWFSTFVIDKGKNDGIKVDMNVIAGGGLVGIVTHVGKSSATVRAIIDDKNNVSAMLLSTSDNCMIEGNLKTLTEKQAIEFSILKDEKNMAAVGDQVVTSQISDKYLQGILIGYISSITKDTNNLTKRGTITPVVDFEHLEEVLVILQKKEIE